MQKKENRRKTGSLYEEKARKYLEEQGLFIKEQNFRCRLGEIDLIAKDGKYLVFVEVKYRRTGYAGNPLCAVNRQKQRIISRVAGWYLIIHGYSVDVPCRFDVIGFQGDQIIWVKNAFDYCE